MYVNVNNLLDIQLACGITGHVSNAVPAWICAFTSLGGARRLPLSPGNTSLDAHQILTGSPMPGDGHGDLIPARTVPCGSHNS